ncbi:MAG: BrnT family toxin [Chloroflexota bacterium]
MNRYRFWWDDDNIDHMADHGVEPHEAESVLLYARNARKVGQGKYVVYGQTDGGRYLMVVYAPKENQRIRVVTARDME